MWAIKSQKYWLVLVKNFHHESETGSDVFNWHHNDRILYIWGTHWVPFSWRHLHLGRRVKHLVLRDLKNKMATQLWSNNIVELYEVTIKFSLPVYSFRHQVEPTNDPVIINATMFVCKTMHDSVKWVYFYGVFTAECGLTETSFTKWP